MRQRKKKAVYTNPAFEAGYNVLRNPQQTWQIRKAVEKQDNQFAAQLTNRAIRYETDEEYRNQINEQLEKESARQRREKELADEKRRKQQDELDKRLADTLKEEYRPKLFGGEGYD